MKHRIGKAVIEISVEGCIECGTRWSRNWKVARRVPVTIGKVEGTVTLHICADCQARNESKTYQPLLIEEQ